MYKLIFKSRKEEAERFQDWISDEVLPSIRQTGAYITKMLIPKTREKASEIENYN
ncbi:Bro-N domain-containing protein [Clostridioides difficile]|uniref:BRO-N domain-containing protein n=1 Tax=Clostridioides difficile TaxID=1496 RepID=UPI00038D9989|nr:BRO family, N-terminal domain protein [Clostridioides difficile DA00193]